MKQRYAARRVFLSVESDEPTLAAALALPERSRRDAGDNAEQAVGALYQASALDLIRLAYVMLGDRPTPEDVVQEAFCGWRGPYRLLTDSIRITLLAGRSITTRAKS